MRSFLTNINIVGAVMVSRTQELTLFCLCNLNKWCDKIVVILDNPDEETKKIVEDYAIRNSSVKIIYSPYPGTTKEEEDKDPTILYYRFKNFQGQVRQLVFDELKKMNDEKKVDILIWPDSDEIFSKSMPKLLDKFWNSEYKAITMKAVDVYGDFFTIHNNGMTGHNRIFKYFPELTANPYRWGTNYFPLTRNDRMGNDYILIHLSLLTEKNREWKKKCWSRGRGIPDNMALWKVGNDVRECESKYIKEILNNKPDLNVFEYERGGKKRMPVGINNASDALFESTSILDSMGVRYYLAFGTCLGLVRDKEFIPWDWDCDLIILGEDVVKFFPERTIECYRKFIKLMKSKGWIDVKIKRDIPRWIKDGKESEEKYIRTVSFKKYGVRIDIDPAYISADGKSRIILKGRKRTKFAAVHPREWFDNAISINFMEKDFLIPSPVEDYLLSNYGDTWKTPVYGPMDWAKRPCMKEEYECAKNEEDS